MKFTSAELCKMTVQELADLMLTAMEENDNELGSVKILGKVGDDLFEMTVYMGEYHG